MNITHACEAQRRFIIRTASNNVIRQFIGLLPLLEIQRHIGLLTLQFQVTGLNHFRQFKLFLRRMRQSTGFKNRSIGYAQPLVTRACSRQMLCEFFCLRQFIGSDMILRQQRLSQQPVIVWLRRWRTINASQIWAVFN
ncbi:hypothetical protein KLUYMM157B_23935 [Kluyvera sp. M-M157-B]